MRISVEGIGGAVVTIKVRFSGASGVFIDGIRSGIKRSTPRATARAGRAIVEEIGDQIDAWAEEQTGALKNSFIASVRRSLGGNNATTSLRIVSDSPYALIHEFGGTIKAKNIDRRGRKLLYLQRGGRIFATAKKVRIRAKRYITKASEASLSRVERIFGDMVVAVSRSAARKARSRR